LNICPQSILYTSVTKYLPQTYDGANLLWPRLWGPPIYTTTSLNTLLSYCAR
jgi:hypothetical protein